MLDCVFLVLAMVFKLRNIAKKYTAGMEPNTMKMVNIEIPVQEENNTSSPSVVKETSFPSFHSNSGEFGFRKLETSPFLKDLLKR